MEIKALSNLIFRNLFPSKLLQMYYLENIFALSQMLRAASIDIAVVRKAIFL